MRTSGQKIRRINIFGGPSCGKSTAAAFLYSELKKTGRDIELVREHAKLWAYNQKPITQFDQVYLFAKEMLDESVFLQNEGESRLVVTDCPLILTICYARKYGLKSWLSLQQIANDFEESYPSINVVLLRNQKDGYDNAGRYETEKEAIELDSLIINHLKEHAGNIQLIEIPTGNLDRLHSLISFVLGDDANVFYGNTNND